MEKIMLFIPMYNCSKQITKVLDQFDDTVLKYIKEIVVINNRSTDDGEKVVKNYIAHTKMKSKITLLRNDENYGLGGTHKVAFQYAMDHGYDYAIVLHGDNQGNIKDFLPYLESKDYQNYDSYLGARFQKGSRLINYSKFRTFGNRVYNILFSIVTHKKIYDLGSGLNMYKVDSLRNYYYLKFPDNLTFNYCMVMAIHYYKQNVKFVPISWSEDDQVSNVKMFSQARRVLAMLFSYFIHHKKFMERDLREHPDYKYTAKVIATNKEKSKNEKNR